MIDSIIKKITRNITVEYNYLTYRPKPVIFDHIPKCAGTSINKYLYSYYPSRFIYRVGANNNRVKQFKSLSREEQARYKFINGHFANFLVDDVNSCFNSIAVFREPIDRIVSHYYYIKRSKKHPLHKDIFLNRQISLYEYCSKVDSIELRNFYVLRYSGLNNENIEKSPDESIELAYENIINKYDLVGFQENLPSFMKKLSGMLGIPENRSGNAVENKTSKRKTLDKIDKSTIESISNHNQLDIKLYDKLRNKFM